MNTRTVLVLASGGNKTPHPTLNGEFEYPGGSCFQRAVEESRARTELGFEVIAVATSWKDGGVANKAEKLGVRCHWLPKALRTPEGYRRLFEEVKPDLVAALGWLPPVVGHDPRTTIGSHPALLPICGGHHCHGTSAHQLAHRYGREKRIAYSGYSMMFLGPFDPLNRGTFDIGPNYFQILVPMFPSDTAEKVEDRVRAAEQEMQCTGISLVATGQVVLDDDLQKVHYNSPLAEMYRPMLVLPRVAEDHQ